MESCGGQWTLRVGEANELRDPFGQPVPLSYRKIFDLLLELAQAGKDGCRRTDLERRIWRNCSDDARKVNLRQALNRLRRAVGSDAIFSDRRKCVLLLDVVIDARHRSNSKPDSGEVKDAPTPDLGPLLVSLSKTHPRQALEMLTCCREYCNGITPSTVMEVVNRSSSAIRSDDSLFGMSRLWQAHIALGADGVRTAISLFRSTLVLAQTTCDHAIAKECILMIGICHILSGNPGTAVELAKCRVGRPFDLQTLRATSLLHLGSYAEAVMEFERLLAASESSLVELGNQQTRLAFYHAVEGDIAKARRHLEPAERSSRETGHAGMVAVCSLARAYIALRENAEAAVEEFSALIESSRKDRFAHYELYAKEGLASAYGRLGQTAEARKLGGQSRAFRTKLGFGMTAWDQKRVQCGRVA
jgi:tetratricopeptide (TPR) repeat protein